MSPPESRAKHVRVAMHTSQDTRCSSLQWMKLCADPAQMLARMKQDMGSTPKVSEAPQEEALLQQQAPELPGKPGHARKPSLGADVTPRSGSSQRRKSMVSISVLFMKRKGKAGR